MVETIMPTADSAEARKRMGLPLAVPDGRPDAAVSAFVNEWYGRLVLPGDERWMNLSTKACLAAGLADPVLRGVAAWSLAERTPPSPERMAAVAAGPERAKTAFAAVLSDTLWMPDRNRLTRIDRDLKQVADAMADKTGILTLRAYMGWLASDVTRLQICMTRLAASGGRVDDLGACMAFCLLCGILPAGRTMDPIVEGIPDPFGKVAA